MKIEDLKIEKKANRKRTAATILWEDCDRPAQELYFETVEEFAQDVWCNPHAFLVACILPAMRFGEKRISIDAEICPELYNGLITAMKLVCCWFNWYEVEKDIVQIEGKKQHYVPASIDGKNSGFLFSGGVDSLATLRYNRLYYSKDHPGYIKDGLLIFGLEVNELKRFDPVLTSVSVLAQDADLNLVPVYTNIRDIGPEEDYVFWHDFWHNEFMGATFAAVAHAFSKRLSILNINASHDIPYLIPHGSHPLLDPLYSSSDLRIRHEGFHLSRIEKVKLISDWDIALQHLRVCNTSKDYEPDRLNCGKCEKCVRTMLALLASGALEKAGAFAAIDVSPELIGQAFKPSVLRDSGVHYALELTNALKKTGRNDLVLAIRDKIDEFYHFQRKQKWRKRTIEPIKEFDRKYFKGNLKKLKHKVFA
jgi:hypothetical protein